MIFGRKKKARSVEDEADAATTDATVEEPDEPDEAAGSDVAPVPADQTDADEATTDEATTDEAGEEADADGGLDTAALDATEWRTDGPFEVGELSGDDEPADDQPRIDLGSIIVSPVPGSELRLQVNEAQDIVSAMLVLPVTAPATASSR